MESSRVHTTLFLDAILASHPGWLLAVERSACTPLDPATLALLAKAHGTRLAVMDASEAASPQRLSLDPGANVMPAPELSGALVVCSASVLAPDRLLRELPGEAALLVLDDEGHMNSTDTLAAAGFVQVDSISVPHGASFWIRRRPRPEFAPEKLSLAFQQCLHKGGGMATGQYFRIVAEILRHAPGNVLVFGAGADTSLYVAANAGGRTTVVEHRSQWRERISSLKCEAIAVQYDTTVKAGLLDEVNLPRDFPAELLRVPWDVILVDSPEGHQDDMPGRQQSIYAASRAKHEGTTVFLHDFNRDLESHAAHRYLGQPIEVLGTRPSLAVFNTLLAKRAVEPTNGQPSKASPSVPPPQETRANERLAVAVIIPTFNEGEWLKRTVESVLAAKTELEYEIVVVDDASTDGSVETVRHLPRVRVVSVGDQPVGCVIGRNLGAKAARGEYLCFLDSHVLVRDGWLDQLRETAIQYQDRAFVSGNILNVDHMGEPDVDTQQYAYTLKSWSVESAWHFHGHGKKSDPYRAPLCPAGLMFVKRSYFWDIGGFSERIKKWGGTDVEISLKNYMYGGENIVDPRVFIYHYYKNTKDRKPTFSISYKQTFFNRLFIAKAFGSDDVYQNAQSVLARKARIDDFVREVESAENQRFIQTLQKRFVRRWSDFARDFKDELKDCFAPIEPADKPDRQPGSGTVAVG